ncbi:MAG: 2-iminoacetate synthase ThiH [Clostridiales bacterium]|jgi:2-iminoacetate synthase|nr:2-iminoacetate synthase ThiH [Clostridiales bacterium]
MNGFDSMTYLEGMERVDSDIGERVLKAFAAYDPDEFTEADVKKALSGGGEPKRNFAALLSPAAAPFLEDAARLARAETAKHFGNSRYLFTPLYISNYCQNQCVYCGFNCRNKIERSKLNPDEIEREMEAVAKSGLREILILTGESPGFSNVGYIGEACRLARKYFNVVGLEIYPVNSDEYAYLHECGADFVTVFQETYDVEKYAEIHPGGRKRSFPYRFNAQERAVMGGIRGVGFAALLGIADFRRDAYAAGIHAYLLQKKYPHAEISFSCPRIRPAVHNGGAEFSPDSIDERQLLQVITALRIFMPFAGITISSRENAVFRDNAVSIAATKISAGVDVGIGGRSGEKKGGEQFEIDDARTVGEIYEMLKKRGLQPVMSEYLYL